MPDELQLHLLGGLGLTRGSVPLRGFLSAKVQALLCYLAVTGRAHSREALMALLWGDMPEDAWTMVYGRRSLTCKSWLALTLASRARRYR